MKALVFDLDDTLLNTAKEIGPRTREALDEWVEQGGELIFATSRPFRTVRGGLLPPAWLDQCAIITMNGAVQHTARQLTYKAPGLGDVGRTIAARFPPGDAVHLTAEINGEEFATNYSSTDAELMKWNAATRDMVLPLADVDFDQVAKIALSRWNPRRHDLLLWLQILACDPIMAENGTFINVMAPGVDKSTTLARHLKAQGWGRADIAVFGDDVPDLKMMALSDHAVAMANAKPEVKAAAHHIIGHCNDDVIGPYLEQWL